MAFKTLYIKTTGTCNLNCDHCFTSGRNGDKTHFDVKQTVKWVNEYIKQFPNDTQYHFELHGGEPFLVPVSYLKEFADEYVDNVNMSICANSNLTFKLTDDIVNFIKKYFNSHIGTSWDNWIRWDNEKQKQLWESNLKILNDNVIDIHLKVSVSKELIEQSPEWFINEINKYNVYDVSLERITVGGNASDEADIFPDNEKQDNWYLSLFKEYKKGNANFKIRTLDILEDKIKKNVVKVDTNCRNCEQNLVTINSNGTLAGCPNTASEKKHSTIFQPIKLFMHSDGRLNDIAKELTFNDNCISCDVFDLCGGDCHRLPWQDGRCGGLKNTLRYISNRI